MTSGSKSGTGTPRALRGMLLLAGAALAAATAAAADTSAASWLAAEGDQAPAGWTIQKSKDSKGTVAFHAGELLLSAEPGRFFNLEHVLGGVDGTDEAPLTATCMISALDDAAAARRPAELAFYWGPDAYIAVGLGPQKDGKAEQRAAWVEWSTTAGDPDKHHLVGGTFTLYPRQAAATFRLVVSAHAVLAYASVDGWTPQLLQRIDRKDGFSAAPDRVIIGRPAPPQVGQDARPQLENDPGGGGKDEALAHWRFSNVGIETASSTLSPALLKTYDKKGSLDDTKDAIAASGVMKAWKVLGPFAAGPAEHGPETKVDLGADYDLIGGRGKWKDFTTGDSPNARIIVLNDILPGQGGSLVRYAAATITADQPRLERFWFDGLKEVRLYVNGREIGSDARPQDGGEVVADRLGACAWLGAGDNTVVVKVVSDNQSHAAFTCRHEPGDVHQRIAVEKRLNLDFPDESGSVIDSWRDIAACWESLGLIHEAANALDSLARLPDLSADTSEDALVERARLHHLLGDEAAMQQDIDALSARWSTAGADPTVARLKAAHLWTRLGVPERAAKALAEAADAPGATADQIVQIGLERARLAGRDGDQPGVATALRALAKRLPDTDSRRGIFLVQALICDQAANAPDIATNLAALPPLRDATALRLLAGLQDQRKDAAGHLATLRALAALNLPGGPYDDPLVTCAEEILAAKGDQAEALALYRKAITQLTAAAPAASDLAGLRMAYWRACLEADPAGAALSERMAKVPATAAPAAGSGDGSPVHDWMIVGPIDNPNWACYDKPPVDPANVDPTKPVAGKEWIKAPADGFDGNGSLDLNKPWGPQSNCVALLVTDVMAPADQAALITAGADDGLTLWVNGTKVHEDRNQRACVPDEMEIPVKLKKGRNRILAMVQQGGGGWGIEMRVNLGQANDLEAALAQALRGADRASQAKDVAHVLERLVKNNAPEMPAVSRLLLRGFADQREVANHAAENLVNTLRWRNDVRNTADAAAWLEISYTEWADHLQFRSGYLMSWGSVLVDMGDLPLAQEMLEHVVWTDFSPAFQGPALGWMGELKRRLGLPRQAVADLNQALAVQNPDAGLTNWINERLAMSRSAKVPASGLTPDFESDSQMRSAVGALTGDVDHAVTAFQNLLNDHADNLCHDASGRIATVSTVVAAHLAALPAAAIAGYRDHHDARAREAIAKAGDDPYALMRAVQAYPWSTGADQARARAAALWLDHGQPALAAGTAEELLALPATLQDTTLDRGALTALWASAAAAAGDRAAFARAEAALARLGQVTLAGKPVDAKAFAAALERRLPPVPAAPAAAAPATIATFQTNGEDGRFSARLGGGDHVVAVPAVLPGASGPTGAIAVANASGVAVIDLPTGAVRWRSGIDLPGWRDPASPRGAPIFIGSWVTAYNTFAGLPLRQVAAADGRVFARLRRGANEILEARNAADGTLLWSTEAAADFAGMSMASSPVAADGTVYALFTDTQVWAVAIDAASGALRWRTVVALVKPQLPVIGDVDLSLAGFLPAPAPAGRDCFIATNSGSVLDLDAATGAIRWQTLYGRSMLEVYADPGLHLLLRRSPTAPLVGSEHLWLAPADFPGVICLERKDGSVRWHQDIEPARILTLAGAPGAERLLLQGEVVDCLDGGSGDRLWRAQPHPGDATIGRALVAGDTCLVATGAGLWRIGLADGASRSLTPWGGIPAAAIPGSLALCGDTLVGVGDGVVAVFGAAKAAPAPLFTVPSDQPIPSAGLPAGAPGQPLALQWRVPGGGGVISIDTPNGAAPGDGECYVRFNDSVARIDVTKAQVRWRTPIPSGCFSFHIAKDAVIAHYGGDLLALDRETGVVRWHANLLEGSYGDVFSMVRPQGDEYQLDADGDYIVDCHPWWTGQVTCRSAADGHIQQRWTIPDVRICIVVVANGHVFSVIQHNGHFNVDERDPTGATLPVEHDLGLPVVNDNLGAALLPDRSGVLVTSNDKSAIFVFATGAVTPATAQVRIACRLWKEDGKLVCFGVRQNYHWGSFISELNGTNLFAEETMDNGNSWEDKVLFADHYHGGHIVHFEFDRDVGGGKHMTGFGQKSFDGKLGWFVPISDLWQCRLMGMLVGDKFAEVFTGGTQGDFKCTTIDLDAGKAVGTTTLPGWSLEIGGNMVAMPLKEVAGHVLYGTPDGLFAAVRGGGGKPANPELASIAADPAAAAIPVPKAANPIVPDGNLDDWQGIAARTLGDDARRQLGDAAPGAAPVVTLRTAWDNANLYLAVETNDPVQREATPGALPLLGDCLVVGIDPRTDDLGGTAPTVFSLSLANGQPRQTTLVGNWLGDDRPSFRIAMHPGGMVYECAIPWSSLRQNQDQRPGPRRRLRLGVALFDRDQAQSPEQASEFGNGLARIFDKQLMRMVECMDPGK